ncbi:unnamed protein product [Camellia sinensis]
MLISYGRSSEKILTLESSELHKKTSTRSETIVTLAGVSSNAAWKEEVSNQKLAAPYIHRQLREVDEANLLDEEDH